jgi:hypothetical protein
LLDRYPVIAADQSEAETEPSITAMVPAPEIAPTNFVDLDQWIIAVDKAAAVDERAERIEQRLDVEASQQRAPEEVDSKRAEGTVSFVLSPQVASLSWTQLAQRPNETQLAFEFSEAFNSNRSVATSF